MSNAGCESCEMRKEGKRGSKLERGGKKTAKKVEARAALHRLSSLQLRLTAALTSTAKLLLRVIEPAHDHFALDSL